MSPHKRRTIALPIAMVLGALFYKFFDSISYLIPYLIFAMLFVTFCRVSAKEVRFTPLHWMLITIQLVGGVAIYFLLCKISGVVAQGAMICAFAPTAMAATAIGGMLGANVATMASFCLMSNMGVAIAAPLLFSAIGANPEISFIHSFVMVLAKVVPLLILPFILSLVLEKVSKRWHKAISDHQGVSFWLWAVSLTIVVGRTVQFLVIQPSENYTIEFVLAGVALVLCLIQFAVGRRIGRKYGDRVAGGQSLGQKNTVLAIWMAQTWLDPLSSIAPAAYVIWQNIVNSWQLWRYKEETED